MRCQEKTVKFWRMSLRDNEMFGKGEHTKISNKSVLQPTNSATLIRQVNSKL